MTLFVITGALLAGAVIGLILGISLCAWVLTDKKEPETRDEHEQHHC